MQNLSLSMFANLIDEKVTTRVVFFSIMCGLTFCEKGSQARIGTMTSLLFSDQASVGQLILLPNARWDRGNMDEQNWKAQMDAAPLAE